jgi:hypothetical protein
MKQTGAANVIKLAGKKNKSCLLNGMLKGKCQVKTL